MSNNNTFIFNLDWYAVLSEYPAEVRFEVYEAIMRYAASGTLPNLKPLAKMAFSFIKKEMDYNRERYETTVEKRRSAGKRSAEVRSQQMSANPTNVEGVEQNQHVLTKPTDVNKINTCQQKEQVSTNPTHNYNDNVNDNELSSTTTRVRVDGGAADADFNTDESFIRNFFADRVAVEAFCMHNKLSPDDFRRIADEILTEWRLSGQSHATEKEARLHLLNQSRIKIRNRNNGAIQEDRYSKRRGVDSDALGPEDFTGEV
ncbi:MAG: hypothetical protein HDS14_08395 [Bacteroides sp.]|nr:hypothetical protein [Bacteroides sp.]